MLEFLEVLPDDYWKNRKCSRCKHKFKSYEDWHTSHGWDEFCTKCEKSFNKWMKRGASE